MQRALLTVLLIIVSLNGIAQPAWMWGRSGGSQVDNFNDNTEFIHDMAADKNGNIYAIGKVYADALHVDGVPVTGQGAKDIVLTSFTCDGTYRWSRVIGGDQFDDVATAVKVDTLGGVYVCGNITMLPGTTGHFGDTVVSTTVKSLFLVKFDADGDFQWLRMPQADTVDVTAHSSVAVDMDVTKGGDVQLLCSLAPGLYADGALLVPVTDMVILKYNSSGIYSGAVVMDMNITGASLNTMRMVRNHSTGRYYISGGGFQTFGSVFIGGVAVPEAMYVASFDQQGLHLWTQRGVLPHNNLSGFFGRPQIDDSGFVYLSGHTALGDTFAHTYTAVNTFGTLGTALPFIAKLDSSGNVQWATNANSSASIYRSVATLRNNDELILTGSYSAELEWPGYAGPHPHHGQFQAHDIFVTRFNTHTGAVIKVDTLSSDAGSYESATAIAPDGKGGVVVGGYYTSSLIVSTDTLLITGGSEPEFFIARYAETCWPLQTVDPLSSSSFVDIYPNPASTQLTIACNTELREISIINTLGQTVHSETPDTQKATLNIAQLPPGMYLVRASDLKGSVWMQKIIKE